MITNILLFLILLVLYKIYEHLTYWFIKTMKEIIEITKEALENYLWFAKSTIKWILWTIFFIVLMCLTIWAALILWPYWIMILILFALLLK